jgi:hypothetical protein
VEIANVVLGGQEIHIESKHLKMNTKSAQSSALENTRPERAVSAVFTEEAVVSLHPITPKYNNKFPASIEAENRCSGASGGGNATAVGPSLPFARHPQSM